jgi:hypothetical protein
MLTSALLLLALWFLVAGVLVCGMILLCLLFGRNSAPPQVPNKAVWG